jgi:hypothetical protein
MKYIKFTWLIISHRLEIRLTADVSGSPRVFSKYKPA